MHQKSSAKICEVNHHQQEEQVAHAQADLTWRSNKKWTKRTREAYLSYLGMRSWFSLETFPQVTDTHFTPQFALRSVFQEQSFLPVQCEPKHRKTSVSLGHPKSLPSHQLVALESHLTFFSNECLSEGSQAGKYHDAKEQDSWPLLTHLALLSLVKLTCAAHVRMCCVFFSP